MKFLSLGGGGGADSFFELFKGVDLASLVVSGVEPS